MCSLAGLTVCGGDFVIVSGMYYSIRCNSASLQEFFLLATCGSCGGDSFSFAELSAEGASNTYLLSDNGFTGVGGTSVYLIEKPYVVKRKFHIICVLHFITTSKTTP